MAADLLSSSAGGPDPKQDKLGPRRTPRPTFARQKGSGVATPPGGPQSFWRLPDEGAVQEADSSLIGRLLGASASPAVVQAPEPEVVVDLDEVVIPIAVESGEAADLTIRLAAPEPRSHRLVSLPVDHRRSKRVVRLHEPHMDRSLTETDKFEHWRRWMVDSKRKESV